MKFKVLLACAALALAVSACRKKAATPPPAPPAPPPAANAAPEGTPANPGNASEMALSNASVLTLMLQEFMAVNKRPPTSLKELETIKMFGAVPPAPPGYRYVIDATNKRVTAQKQ